MPGDLSDTDIHASRGAGGTGVARVGQATAPPPGSAAALDPQALAALRDAMLRFALLQLRDAAEDLVQEAIEAALRSAASFAGRSSLKTWVFAILRNRIVDHLRQSARTVTMSSLVDDGDDWQERVATLFDGRGEWRPGMRPQAWPDPEESMRTRQFWVVLETCLERLPPATARIFMMREFLGFESGEICRLAGISPGNCHVILHRAREAARLPRQRMGRRKERVVLSCLEATEACSAEMERPLRLGKRVSLGAHLMMCGSCNRYRKQIRLLREAMREYAEGRAPDGDEDGYGAPADEAPRPGGRGAP